MMITATLNNAQGVPCLQINDEMGELARIYFCKDGGLIWWRGNVGYIGTRIGCREKGEQDDEYFEAPVTDGYPISGELPA